MSKNKKNLIRIAVVAVLFAVALSCYIVFEEDAPWWAWLIVFVPIYLAIGYDVLWCACKNIARGKVFDENFLMVIATVGAFCVLEFAEAVAVMLFYQVGELFQSYAVGKSRKSIAALMDICPETARVLDDDGERVVPPEAVELGSIVVVKPGERVPIDGEAIEGSGYLDCSALTGESAPVSVRAGDAVLSGAISSTGVIKIRTTKKYEDSTVAKILDLVENASSRKAKSENFITRFAAVYTPAVVIAALLLAVIPPLCIGMRDGAVWSEWITRALTFLVVSCPCALVISVPMSFFGGIGAASKLGILVKGGNYLELLNKVDTFVFDKTGTVTKGSFEVVGVTGEREQTLSIAACAEACSAHPIAQSVVAAAREFGDIPIAASAEEIAGHGVIAELDGARIACGNDKLMRRENVEFEEYAGAGGTVVYVARNGKFIGAIEIADAVKDDSAAAIAELNAGCRTVILSGDREETAKRVAAAVGASEYRAELLPDQKVTELERIIAVDAAENGKDKTHGKKRKGAVAFVGDGINDAPAISRADVGIAMGGLGSDAAIEAADIVLMTDKLSLLPKARRIAKKTVSIVIENIVLALVVKLAVLVLAALGFANMWLAVFADVGVAVLAILNSMRALRFNKIKDKSSVKLSANKNPR